MAAAVGCGEAPALDTSEGVGAVAPADPCARLIPKRDPQPAFTIPIHYDPTGSSFGRPETDESSFFFFPLVVRAQIPSDRPFTVLQMFRLDGSTVSEDIPTGVVEVIGQRSGFTAIVNVPATTEDPRFAVTEEIDETFAVNNIFPPRAGDNTGIVAANDPTGGMVIFNSGPEGPIIYAVAADGSLRWPTPTPAVDEAVLAMGVDRVGRILYLVAGDGHGFGPATVAGQWLETDGQPRGPLFKVLDSIDDGQSRPDILQLSERVGSGFFLRGAVNIGRVVGSSDGGAWLASIDSGSTTVAPAPLWLQVRSDARYHMAYGGIAYAVLEENNIPAVTCTQTALVIAPDGRVCGGASFDITPTTVAPCFTDTFAIGYDGSVMQRLPRSLETCNGSQDCTAIWKVYPRIFASEMLRPPPPGP